MAMKSPWFFMPAFAFIGTVFSTDARISSGEADSACIWLGYFTIYCLPAGYSIFIDAINLIKESTSNQTIRNSIPI